MKMYRRCIGKVEKGKEVERKKSGCDENYTKFLILGNNKKWRRNGKKKNKINSFFL